MSDFRPCKYFGPDCLGIRNCLICGPLPEEQILINPKTAESILKILSRIKK